MKNCFYKTLIFFLVHLSPVGLLRPQEPMIQFEHITTEQGLSSDTIYDMIQDRWGFMWFATRDGLNRFDGHSVREFKYSSLDTNSIAVNWCESLHEDRFGKVWIGTLYGGLNVFDPVTEKFQAYKHDPENPHSISNDVVLAISEDDSGNFWLGTWHGLDFLHHNYIENPDPKIAQFIHYNHDPLNPNSLSDDRIWSLCIDSEGIIWIGTDAGGLNRFDQTTNLFKNYRHNPDDPNSLRHNLVKCIYEDPVLKRRTLWIATHGGGLHKFDVADEIFECEKDSLPASSGWRSRLIMSVTRVKNGDLWAGAGNGFKQYIFDIDENFPYKFAWHKKNVTDLTGNGIKTIYEDRTGVLWFGTLGSGVNRVFSKQKKFHKYKNMDGICVYEDAYGVLWTGGVSGLCRIDRCEPSIITYSYRPNDATSLSSKEVYAIVEEPDCADQTLWILCRDGGLDRITLRHDPSANQKVATIDHILPIPSDSMSQACKYGLAMVRDKNGMLWIGANEGLFQFDPKNNRVTPYQSDPVNPKTRIKARVDRIYQSPFDSENILWVGTNNGLYQVNLDRNIVIHYKHEPQNINSLNDNRILSLLADTPTRGRIFWIGTFSAGLNRFDIKQGTFSHFTQNDGLPSNAIYSILQDDKGQLWLGTDNGLTKFHPETHTYNTYHSNDNLRVNIFYPGGALKSRRTGEMFFCGYGGFVSFYPDSIIDNSNIPQIVLTDFKLFDKPVKLDTAITNIKQIKLSYDQNFFSFQFAALDYTNPSENQYAYKLQGLDRDWVYAGNRTVAYYTDVKPGVYTFRVKGSNNDGIWNENGTSVKIIITPPFWLTWWFYSLVGLVLVGMLGWGYHFRLSLLVKERNAQQAFSRKLIEEIERGRKRIANELHDSLGQNLLITKNEITECLNTEALSETCASSLKEISSLVSESIREVREIAYNLHPHQLDRLGLTRAIESIITKLSHSAPTVFSLEIENVDGLVPKENEIHIYRIIQEGLNNVIRHAKAKQVWIKISRTDDAVKILIKDDGKGFDPKKYDTELIPSSGLGLAGIAERVKILNGDCNIEAARKKGASLKISIPITG